MAPSLIGGRGFCFIDRHGYACKAIAAATPRSRVNYVIYFDPSELQLRHRL